MDLMTREARGPGLKLHRMVSIIIQKRFTDIRCDGFERIYIIYILLMIIIIIMIIITIIIITTIIIIIFKIF